MRIHHIAAAGAAILLLAASVPAQAATLFKATVIGVITHDYGSTNTFGVGALVGQTYKVVYYFDPTLGTESLYDPAGPVFDKVRSGLYGNSPIRSYELTVGAHTEHLFADMVAQSGQVSRTQYADSRGHFGAIASGAYAPTPAYTDYQSASSTFNGGATPISQDFTAPFSGPATGQSSFLRQVKTPGSAYPIAYKFDGSISSVSIGLVPEPATWAMLIIGFGAVGAALRGRRRTAAA